MTLLSDDPDLWDTVFLESAERSRFVRRVARRIGGRVLDVGCATGALCRHLSGAGAQTVGVDLNRRFIAKAQAADPGGRYVVGNMRSFRVGRRFDLLVCVGTTFSYNLTNRNIQICLRNFRAHLREGGFLLIDVLNAAAFLGPRRFKLRTRHEFVHAGGRAVATIHHRLHLKKQVMSEQVSWAISGRMRRRDPAEALRLFFPQELAFHLESAGFDRITLADRYGSPRASFNGKRLIALARRAS